MTKVCFDTEEEFYEIQEDLEYASMVLLLKGEPDIRHMKGLQKAFSAVNRGELVLEKLRNAANPSAHEYERYQDIVAKGRQLVKTYQQEFLLEPKMVEPEPEVVRSNGQAKKRAHLDVETVKAIKYQISLCGQVINWEDIAAAAHLFPGVSETTIYQIATGGTWADVPWPDHGKAPTFKKRSER